MIQIKGYWTLNGSKKWHAHRRRFHNKKELEQFKALKGDVLFHRREIPGAVKDQILKEFMHKTPTFNLLAIKWGVSVSYVGRIITKHLTKA